MKSRRTSFRRDKKYLFESLRSGLNQLIFVGDIFVPLLDLNMVDELVFYPSKLAIVRNGEVYSYHYSQVKVEFEYFGKKRNTKDANVLVRIKTREDSYKFTLDQKKSKPLTANFSIGAKELVYQCAANCSSVKERRVKPRISLISILLAASLIGAAAFL